MHVWRADELPSIIVAAEGAAAGLIIFLAFCMDGTDSVRQGTANLHYLALPAGIALGWRHRRRAFLHLLGFLPTVLFFNYAAWSLGLVMTSRTEGIEVFAYSVIVSASYLFGLVSMKFLVCVVELCKNSNFV